MTGLRVAIHRIPGTADVSYHAASSGADSELPEGEAAISRQVAAISERLGTTVEPGAPPGLKHRTDLRLSTAACRREPEMVNFRNALRVALYRSGLSAKAPATLARTNDLNKGKEPSNLDFLSLAQKRLGQFEKARETLRRLREVMKDRQRTGDQAANAFLCEAETIELNRVFPANPFAC